MPIPEDQLETWSRPGSRTQSAETYQTFRRALEHEDSPYSSKQFEVFLQGSYGNHTNVWRDSDVDIVIRLDSSFQHGLELLGEAQKAAFHAAHSDATYGYRDFKGDVLTWLRVNFGSDVEPGSKAITIKARNNRREADVLPCSTYRHYLPSSSGVDDKYVEGISFYRSDGTRIVNFPAQHAANCTTKHGETNEWFKPMVRVLKNIRNRMVEDNIIRDGLAPSYFLEGMLWNAPNNLYGRTFSETFVQCISWIGAQNRGNFMCANGIHWLLRDDSPTSWNAADCNAFLRELANFWSNWR